MSEQSITVEIDGRHTFTFDEEANPGVDLLTIFDNTYVVEKRDDDALTLHPVSRITAVYVGKVPSRQVGFPSVPRGR